MEPTPAYSGFDGAMAALLIFAVFFFWLVFFHLRPQDKREGYPTIRPDGSVPFRQGKGLFPMPKAKEIRRPHGQPTVVTPRSASQAGPQPEVMPERNGKPLHPRVDGLLEGIGPAAWSEREDVADLNKEGDPKLASMLREPEYSILEGCPDPRGWPVQGGDQVRAGAVRDIWFNRAEFFPRYMEVESEAGDYLLPIFFAVIDSELELVIVRDMPGERLSNAPFRRHDDRITLLEEDKVNAFFAGGRFYGNSPRGKDVA
ncbi:MAG: photosynthetic reaction center subunit H [Oceanicaulis sp.]